jgi:host factor-I protein
VAKPAAQSSSVLNFPGPRAAPVRRGGFVSGELEARVMNRKLIRPDLTELKEHRYTAVTTPKYFRQRRAIPPDTTNAENNYYIKQMANRTRMVIVLKDGSEIRGTIEWYDRAALKVHRPDAPNILLMKDTIKYMYKENEDKFLEDEDQGAV